MAAFSQGLFQIDASATPDQIKRKRAMIQDMLANSRPTTIGAGIGDMLAGIAGGIQNNRLDKVEKTGMESGSQARSSIMASLLGGKPASAASAPEQASVSPISATGVDVAKRLQQDFGLSAGAAAGFAGNLAHESGDFKTLQEINPLVKGSRGGFGWAQWTGPRRRQFEAWAGQNGLDPASPEANYGFLKHELTSTPEGAVIKALQGVNDPAQAAQIVSSKFLRPGIPHMGSRITKAQQIANMLAGNDAGVQVASLDPSIGMAQTKPAVQAVNAMASGAPTQAQQPSPAPQAVQAAQAAPQSPQTGGIDLPTLMQAIQNPWLDDTTKQFALQRIQSEMQKQDPAYQQEQQLNQLQMQKAQMELQQMQNPKPKMENVGGRLVQIMPDGTVKEAYAPPADVTTEITDVNGKRVLVNKATGETVRELGDSPSKQQNAPAGYQMNADGKSMTRIPGYRDTNLEMDMRKEFDAQTKDFRSVRDSYNRIQASAENPTPAGDLSLIFNYMKMLDPGSVVRESEFATASNAAPLLTRYGLDPEKLKGVWEGQKLTPEQRADFVNRSNQLYAEQDQTFQSLADQYSETAKRNGLDPSNIILTPRSNPRKKKEPVIIDGYQIEQVD